VEAQVIDILIPTLGRHLALAPLAANLLNTTPPDSFRAVFVADEADAETRGVLNDICYPDSPRWLQIVEDGSYPHKINAAYHATQGDLVLPTADDVVFHDGWLDAAVNALRDPSVQVVGTDDLSPVTEKRKLATMPILRRSYVEHPGASWGEPGGVFHEGYHHSFVDRELWELAIHRGVAAWADGCVIEHLHPSFGKREVDETDRKGNLSNWDEDEALFLSRREQWPSS
jgi:glycosyltransferase involved in cell wall biosynthesis